MAKKTGQVYNLPGTLYADGDYLIYDNHNKWPRAHTGNAVAIDLRTQQAEELRLGGSGVALCSLKDGILYYYENLGDEDSPGYKTEYHELNMETREDTMRDDGSYWTHYLSDGEYYYDLGMESNGGSFDSAEYSFWRVLNVYDHAGNLLHSIDLPENERYQLVKVLNGDLYLMYMETETRSSDLTEEDKRNGRKVHIEYISDPKLLRLSRESIEKGIWAPETLVEMYTAEATCSLEDQKRYSGQ